KGVQATGELLFPRERKKVKIELDSRLKREIVRVIKEATNIISLENPPRPRRIKYCKNCAYFEFCWS
ncbi:MAG: Dna2/Cas4 domain-containing protein, partial [Actinobacteria bacterium]|nr:Dna2/Cas4 domain-containing protein [Actinomycetota bacterium]